MRMDVTNAEEKKTINNADFKYEAYEIGPYSIYIESTDKNIGSLSNLRVGKLFHSNKNYNPDIIEKRGRNRLLLTFKKLEEANKLLDDEKFLLRNNFKASIPYNAITSKVIIRDIETIFAEEELKNNIRTIGNKKQLQSALEAIKHGVPLREAARHFNIPRATLQFSRSDKFTKISPGPPPILTSTEEELLVKWVVENAQKGFPRRKDLQLAVKSFLDKVPRKNPIKDNYPHEGWYKAFLRRHPILPIRTPEAGTSASSKVSEKYIIKWFEDINAYLVNKGDDGILTDPSRIFQ
ncbi:hypothetical protein JTB14_029170 [Gonioctena quinquepunctata]|nr:hypothetical protein JTB14_029170 [Gonioctena quinquepunctata]